MAAPAQSQKEYQAKEYIRKRKKLSGVIFETALPNEYLVRIGTKDVRPIMGGKKLKIFRKFIRIPASVQTLYFVTDNANVDYQGIGIEGYASWRINPDNPALAITTLDFFDDDDPMARTNNELRTICVEAVRHVISNMTIDEALKKKAEIAKNLKGQLKEIEVKWGLVFDQVGIEKVKIMSNSLFEEMQSQYRDKLRLDVARTKISTDKDIATEENATREITQLKKIETDKKISLVEIENKTMVRQAELEESRNVSQKERSIREEEYRRESLFKAEQQQKDFELSQQSTELELKLKTSELNLAAARREIENLNCEIQKAQLDVERIRRETEQMYTQAELAHSLIHVLPEIYSSIQIDNYSVLDGGSGTVSPVSKILSEVLFAVKNADIASIFKKEEKTE